MGAGIMLIVGFFVVGVGVIAANVLPEGFKNKIVELVNKF
jgi:hypothetical protein